MLSRSLKTGPHKDVTRHAKRLPCASGEAHMYKYELWRRPEIEPAQKSAKWGRNVLYSR